MALNTILHIASIDIADMVWCMVAKVSKKSWEYKHADGKKENFGILTRFYFTLDHLDHRIAEYYQYFLHSCSVKAAGINSSIYSVFFKSISSLTMRSRLVREYLTSLTTVSS